jgi:hypothetical protein
MDINLGNVSYELSKAQVAAAQRFLGRKLDAVESILFSTSFKQILTIRFIVGNEPDFYGVQGYRKASTWSPEAYAAQFVVRFNLNSPSFPVDNALVSGMVSQLDLRLKPSPKFFLARWLRFAY